MDSAPFKLNVPFDVIKSEDTGQMLFGGFVSSGKKDREEEVIIQKGLDFQPWIDRGWFNDNHASALTRGGLVGVPVENKPVQWLAKGDASPLTGDPVERSGWHVMGELLDTQEGRTIYDIGKALQKTHRRLGMSLEGRVMRRKGPTILKAEVHNIAITQRPVNPDTVVEVLTKALEKGEVIEDQRPSDPIPLLQLLIRKVDDLTKALTAGSDIENPADIVRVDSRYITKKALAAGDAVESPAESSPGDGFAFRKEQLDKKLRTITAPRLDDEDEEEKKKAAKKSIAFQEALGEVKRRLRLNDRDALRVTRRVFKQLSAGGP